MLWSRTYLGQNNQVLPRPSAARQRRSRPPRPITSLVFKAICCRVTYLQQPLQRSPQAGYIIRLCQYGHGWDTCRSSILAISGDHQAGYAKLAQPHYDGQSQAAIEIEIDNRNVRANGFEEAHSLIDTAGYADNGHPKIQKAILRHHGEDRFIFYDQSGASEQNRHGIELQTADAYAII
ncbi:MAG: hypothetical protein AVDCRST_MAG93-1737 [uncultured Chloroflexia bacterium]|uniref:Uncharacterized protein n=1 Tax=uncultured Chloroflexia bacterium TaxID=1672391 RepID=A0A6J4IFW6_9CHLR|nr:MAG: hypothetical protein AVDCRST_MAG93-1737 [uncultured Chloroflexia bacterium]